MSEMWYFLFEVSYYDDYDDKWEECTERGVICAKNKGEALERLDAWFGNIYDIRIYDVDMDTNELLFERNFPGLIEMFENPVEGY